MADILDVLHQAAGTLITNDSAETPTADGGAAPGEDDAVTWLANDSAEAPTVRA